MWHNLWNKQWGVKLWTKFLLSFPVSQFKAAWWSSIQGVHDQGPMSLVNIIGIALVILIVRLMGIATKTLSTLSVRLTVNVRLALIVGLMVFAMKNTIITDSVIRTAIVQLTTTVPLMVFATTCTDDWSRRVTLDDFNLYVSSPRGRHNSRRRVYACV